MNKEKFEKKMAAFSWKQHQEFLSYHQTLLANDLTFEDAQEWVTTVLREQEEAIKEDYAKKLKFARKCPVCQSPMSLFPVNYSNCSQTGDDSKSVWTCLEQTCLEQIYNKKSIDEILRGQNSGRGLPKVPKVRNCRG